MKYKQYAILVSMIILSACIMDKKNDIDLLTNLEIIDLSRSQLGLLNKYENLDEASRDSILIDSIFNAHSEFWSGYLGNTDNFSLWNNKQVYPNLETWNSKAKKLNLDSLGINFNRIALEAAKFSEREPKGKWYIIWGPGYANLGGMGDGTMFIDLASFNIESQDDILSAVPHEINHQIYSQTVPDTTYSVIKRVVDEGFACYINNKFFKGKETIAESLYYSEEDYQYCLNNEQEIFQSIKDIYKSIDRDTVDSFASRGIRLREDYPTAIGYFIGYRIVEEYVKRNGPDSWKDIYDLSPEQVLKESGILDK